MTLEVVVYNIESALKAQEGGADRIELCSSPHEGGTTPSFGVIECVRQNISLDLYIMIRPRGGDFLYSTYEFHCMKRDISQCQRLSVDGIVFGILTAEGTIDKKKCKELIDKARPLKATCHRAFDMARDPKEALEDCIEAGFDRILTSGGMKTAVEGIERIRAVQEWANGRIEIMAGSGVNEDNVVQIVDACKVKEIHFSATTYRDSDMKFQNASIATMGTAGNEYKLRSVDPSVIKKIRNLLS